MRVLVTGATGFIGSHLVSTLLKKGHEVVVCVRNTAFARQRWPNAIAIKTEFATDVDAADWTPRLDGVDIVINAVGIISENHEKRFEALHTRTPIALFQACESKGIRRVIQISALGANEKAFSAYHKSKYAADQYLRASNLDWAVVLPSVVHGPGSKSMDLFKAIASLPAVPLIDSGQQLIQPIHIDDMKKAIVALVESTSTIRTDIEMVGPSPITMKNLYKSFRGWLGHNKAIHIRIPYQLAAYGARWVGRLSTSPISEESLRMLQQGNTSHVEPFVDRFGFTPRSIEQALADTPAQQADRWHSRLFFLAPLLRIAIAFVWLYTAFVSAFIYPIELSYAMLSKVGIGEIWQPIMLYGAVATNILLGVATLMAFQLRLVVIVQISIILLYSIIITLWLPEQWAHPFGPMSKNVPLLVAILMMYVLEGKR